jgi:hypothetical protein
MASSSVLSGDRLRVEICYGSTNRRDRGVVVILAKKKKTDKGRPTNKEENQSTNKQPTQSDTHASAAATYINVRIRQTVDKRHLFALLYSTYLRNKKRPRHLFSVKCLPKKEKSIQSFCQSHFSYCQRKTQRGERITKKAISIKLSNYLCATHTS